MKKKQQNCDAEYFHIRELEPTIALLKRIKRDCDPFEYPSGVREITKEIKRLMALKEGK